MKKRIVTTTAVFQPGYPAQQAIHRLKGLGFEALDMALDYCTQQPDFPFLSEQYLQWGAALRQEAEQAGICYTHAHAPKDFADTQYLQRSIEVTAALGAKHLVVHPIWREGDRILQDPEEFISCNLAAVRPWLTLAEEHEVVLLSENLLWGASADPRVIAELVRRVDSPFFGWCYDTGHANCFGYSPRVLTQCAVAPVSLHLQDNDGTGDQHMIPGEGTVDWDCLTDTLRAVNYPGDCVLEAHHQSVEAPDDQRDPILARLLQAAQKLREKM